MPAPWGKRWFSVVLVVAGEPGGQPVDGGLELGIQIDEGLQPAGQPLDGDLFLAAADKLGVPIEQSTVVGDAVWDMLAARRARALGIGLLSGGYSEDELERAGAYRVFEDPADLLRHIDEVGGRGASM